MVFELKLDTFPFLKTLSCCLCWTAEKSERQKKENHLMEEKKKKKQEEKTDVTQKKVRENLWHSGTLCLA